MKALTFRETVVAELFANGWNNQQIALILAIEPNEVKQLLYDVRHKLQISNSTLLLQYWRCELFRIGLVEMNLLPFKKVSAFIT